MKANGAMERCVEMVKIIRGVQKFTLEYKTKNHF